MSSHRHCKEFARAGAGLPAIEHGMPDPAGTGLSRRQFLLRSAGMAIAVYGGGHLAPEALQEGIAAAAEGGPAPAIVNVFFSGGLDSIAILGPYGSGRLGDLRPSLHDPRTPQDQRTPLPFAGRGDWFWHPKAEALDRLHRAGKLVVIPSVGYTDPNQSHFTSRHFWEIGSTDLQVRTGWMGRWLDQPGVGTAGNPLQGLTLGQSLVPSLAAGTMPVAAVETPGSYRFEAEGVWDGQVEPALGRAIAALATTPSAGDPVLAQAKAAQANAFNLMTGLGELGGDRFDVAYPEGVQFGRRLKDLAHMLDEELPIRCAGLIAHGDYDTHAGQSDGFSSHLPKALECLETFQADLEQRGIADRVITLVWSEFGRRPEENGSLGTDHGASAIGFVLGTRARGYVAGSGGRPGVVGGYPDISAGALDVHGNIRHSVDFRDVYGSLLDQWVSADVDAILRAPGRGSVDTSLGLIRAA